MNVSSALEGQRMAFWVMCFENGKAGCGHRKNKADYEQEKSSKGKKVEETIHVRESWKSQQYSKVD